MCSWYCGENTQKNAVASLVIFVLFLDEETYATVSQFWTDSLFFEVVAPDEVAYVYKIKPALDFGVPLVSYCILLLSVVVIVTFFNHSFINCKAALTLASKMYEIKYNISLNDVHAQQ